MDANALFPEGFHPVHGLFLPDGMTPASRHSRKGMPIKYYYIDFGISVHIPPDTHPKLAVGPYGRDREVPELSADIPYDPFKVDIFIIGNLFRRNFHDVGAKLINGLHSLRRDIEIRERGFLPPAH